ncbi:MAG TPA: hypothetical protein VKZ63_05760, partial [Kofleriaceae bacterium]|nr:hypothetical protein [Kofleriaceae bacterium]
MRAVLALTLVAAAACTVPGEEGVELDELDYRDVAGSGVLSEFIPSRLVSDDAFFHIEAMTAADVQSFFEATPYGRRSFLADEVMDTGELLSAALVRVAAEQGMNPLVLLVTLQKEAGLVSRSTAPSRQRVDYAFGCGCPDGRGCSSAYRGLDRQLACAAEHLRSYADAIEGGGTTIGGFAPGRATRVLDGVHVTPANKATAILYTYTPWILRGEGGNWLFWNVWQRYASALGYQRGMTAPFNEGFIGGACAADDDCFYDGGLCRDGFCTLDCDRLCPDRTGGFATTLCVTAG